MKYFTALITGILAMVLAMNATAFDSRQSNAAGESYFDVATGHRYVKNSDATYREYTKKGELFRVSVSADLPVLTNNKYIREIGNNCFIMYEKLDQSIMKKQILPASKKHPRGWRAEAAFACPKGVQMQSTASGSSRQFIATGESYFDVATGHRYVKNSDATYREYTKRGDLFRGSVSPYLPLLTTNRNIREIVQDTCLLYRRSVHQETETLVLPSDQAHPEGWSVDGILFSMN